VIFGPKMTKKIIFLRKISKSHKIPQPSVIKNHFLHQLEEVSGLARWQQLAARQNKPIFWDFRQFT